MDKFVVRKRKKEPAVSMAIANSEPCCSDSVTVGSSNSESRLKIKATSCSDSQQKLDKENFTSKDTLNKGIFVSSKMQFII